MPQYGKEIVFDIKRDPKFDDLYYSKNSKALFPHTEAYEFLEPPRYLALWCEKPDRFGLGFTELSDGYDFVESSSASQREILIAREFLFKPNSGLACEGLENRCESPIFDPEVPRFRYSFNNMEHNGDEEVISLLEAVLNFHERKKIPLFLEEGDLLVFDNFRMMHSRTEFKDHGRHLRRVWLC